MGYGNDVDVSYAESASQNDDTQDNGLHTEAERKPVKDISFDLFREKLVRHFNIAFQFKEIKWPRRLKET